MQGSTHNSAKLTIMPLLVYGQILIITRSHYDRTNTVTITVRCDKKRRDYIASRGLLTWHSSYFAVALDAAAEQILESDYEHGTFDTFCCWMSTGKLNFPIKHVTSIEDAHLDFRRLADIWPFADIRGMPTLGHAAVGIMHERAVSNRTLPHHIIKSVFIKIADGSELRQHLQSLYLSKANVDQIAFKPERLPSEFLFKVLAGLARREMQSNEDGKH